MDHWSVQWAHVVAFIGYSVAAVLPVWGFFVRGVTAEMAFGAAGICLALALLATAIGHLAGMYQQVQRDLDELRRKDR